MTARTTCPRPPARSSAQQRLPARQCAARASGAAGQAAPCTRRGAVAGLALLPALALQLGGTEARAEGPTVQLSAAPAAAVAAAAAEEAAAAVAAPAPWRNYIARDFSFSYPAGLKVIEEDIFAATVPGRPRSTLGACAPCKEEQCVSKEGSCAGGAPCWPRAACCTPPERPAPAWLPYALGTTPATWGSA